MIAMAVAAAIGAMFQIATVTASGNPPANAGECPAEPVPSTEPSPPSSVPTTVVPGTTEQVDTTTVGTTDFVDSTVVETTEAVDTTEAVAELTVDTAANATSVSVAAGFRSVRSVPDANPPAAQPTKYTIDIPIDTIAFWPWKREGEGPSGLTYQLEGTSVPKTRCTDAISILVDKVPAGMDCTATVTIVKNGKESAPIAGVKIKRLKAESADGNPVEERTHLIEFRYEWPELENGALRIKLECKKP
jgi:hypothetical protein